MLAQKHWRSLLIFFVAAAFAGLLWEERGPAILVQVRKQSSDWGPPHWSWLFPSVSCAMSRSAYCRISERVMPIAANCRSLMFAKTDIIRAACIAFRTDFAVAVDLAANL
ncbi:hypothetical protein [Ruegeria faecimaris]|uniref:hypothetical protein n=1 Tax=Ruegeria faecimaris TaxID=686389 RepID=UPI002492591A|nr:hypothetical protein [Ruegeria faecimaris]